MVRIKINNIEFLVNSNLSVLEACQFVGVHVPRFCYHETLSIAGNCRMCLVEIEKSPKPVASCALPISNNISIYTDSPLVKKARENILESLLLNHPLDCPICDQGGECDLQDQTKIFGGDYSRYYINKRSVESKPFGSLIKTIMTRCIHCTRCVRFSEEIAGTSSFGTLNRGKNTEIGGYISNIFDSEVSGNVVDLCPVGALTFKPYAFKARPWELKYQESLDCTSSLCTPILISVKESEIVRIQPKADPELENVIISDKIRFIYDSVKKNRIQQVFKKNSNNNFVSENWTLFSDTIKNIIQNKQKITFLVNENLDLKSAQFLKAIESKNIKIFNTSNFSLKHKNCYDSSYFDKIHNINKKIRTCFLVSTNLKVETTLLNTKLRLKFNKTSFSTINTGNFYKSNYPTSFINLSTKNIIKLFEGKMSNSYNLIKQPNILLILGNGLEKKITETNYLVNFFKKICPTGVVIQNQIYPNSVGFNFLGINSLKNNLIKSTNYFFCINLEDNIVIRKILENKNFFWYNTHGSYLASKSSYVLPGLTFLENENLYMNIDGLVKKTQKILPNLKDTQPCYSVLKIIFDEEISGNSKNSVELYANKNILFKFRNNIKISDKISTFVYTSPNKSIIENFYGDSILSKNSIILSKRVQEQRRNSHSTF
jgi:NADH-quinone oxidoreductase subunit G